MISAPSWPSNRLANQQCSTKRFAFTLSLLACILLVTNLIWVFLLPQAPGRMAEVSALLIPRLPLWSFVVSLPFPIPRQGEQLALAILLLSGTRFGVYALAVYLCWRRESHPLTLGILVGAALLCFLITACALPNLDRDIYNYIVSGRVGAVHASNPYLATPDQFPADPIYPYASPRYTAIPGDNKLPAWMLLNMLLARLGGDDVVTNLLLYRCVFLLFNFANVALIACILRALGSHKELAGVALYAWNPISVAYGQSKVDTLMVFVLLLAILALVYARRRVAVVALTLSVFVKLITLPLLAVYALRELRARKWPELTVSALLVAVTAVCVYAPFWNGPDLLGMHIGLLAGASTAGPPALGLLVKAGFTLAVLWIGLGSDSSLVGLIRGWALVALLFSVFLTRLGFAWYLMTLIALVGLAVEWRMALATAALSLASFVMNTWDSASNDVFPLPQLFRLPRVLVYLVFIGVVGLLIAALALGRRIRQARSV